MRPDYDSVKSDSNGEFEVTYELVQYNDQGDCYLEMSWPSYKFYGTEQFQFALMDTTQNDEYTFIWDSSNDYSRAELKTAEEMGKELNEAPVYVDAITMYAEGVHVWGTPPADAPEDMQSEVLYGDVNCDGGVNVMDVILLNRNLMIGAEITAQGLRNADVDINGRADAADSLNILKAVVKLITLPVG